MNRILSCLKFLFFRCPKLVWALFTKKKYLDKNETYYAELKQKGKLGIALDQLRHIFKWHQLEQYYFLYGFDVKSYKSQKEYLDYSYFKKRRDYLNNHPNKYEIYSYTGILRDKFYFSIFMEKLGFRIPKTIGLVTSDMVIFGKNNEIQSLETMLSEPGKYICKPLDGIGGIGIFLIEKLQSGELLVDGVKASYKDLQAKFSNARYFVQERIDKQHEKMSALYPKSINTLRITTVRDRKDNEIKLMGSMLLMGAGGSIVSNWHYGGVIINVKNDGSLDKYGFSLKKKKILSHPDTGVVFESFKVPYYDEAVKESIRCHKMFYGVHSVGWDFAILPDGVMFIEGNDNWGMAAHQMVSGGLKDKFDKYFK